MERDPLGEVEVPAEAYYGAQTARALRNFPISGLRPSPAFINATVQVKKAAAEANRATGRLDPRIADAIVRAADEVLAGRLHDQFVVDVFQAGAGTSHNMNANEVLANRAIELLGGQRGDYRLVHPNDHVNMAQSTNDVFPTAMRVAALTLERDLVAAMRHLAEALEAKGRQFDHILKSGRTHLQDAVPIRLGQEFAAWGLAVRRAAERVGRHFRALEELNIGATAVGTGLNAEPAYIELVVERLSVNTGLSLRRAASLVEATQFLSPFVEASGALRAYAVDLGKIANDLRLMASGPRTGLGEIRLPAVQPGSSIMPGKVNPVIAEATNMVCFQVIGHDVTIAMAAEAGQLELNVMMPVVAHDLLESIAILASASRVLADRCVAGIEANEARCRELAELSPGLATALAPYIGYEAAAEIAKEAVATGRTVREVARARGVLPEAQLEAILEPYAMTEPGIAGRSRAP
ncbi:MAG TPA: aspartate ammonia-lyase [Thermodesulfobacteriota bacterium]|nr:aspartate ammonia-lyase [Thermodesulfobacteriota bacterium]